MKGLSRQQLIYSLGGAALLVVIILSSYLLTGSDSIVVDSARYNLADPVQKQSYEMLVKAHDKLKTGFDFDAATQQGSALFALQDYDQAIKAWRYFIANRPRAIQGYWGLGEIYTAQGKYLEAEKNWLMAIEVDTPASYANSYIKLDDLYKTTFPDKRYKIVQIVTTAIAKNPTEANYPLILANYYKDTGDNASAIRFFEEVLRLDPTARSANSIKQTINDLKKAS